MRPRRAGRSPTLSRRGWCCSTARPKTCPKSWDDHQRNGERTVRRGPDRDADRWSAGRQPIDHRYRSRSTSAPHAGVAGRFMQMTGRKGSMPESSDTKTCGPFRNVQAHYDLSGRVLPACSRSHPTRKQLRLLFRARRHDVRKRRSSDKLDLALALQPGMTLLDIVAAGAPCSGRWRRYDVNVIGLTLSKNQKDRSNDFSPSRQTRQQRVELEGWEQFNEPVDRIVSDSLRAAGFDRRRRLSSPWPKRAARTTG